MFLIVINLYRGLYLPFRSMKNKGGGGEWLSPSMGLSFLTLIIGMTACRLPRLL